MNNDINPGWFRPPHTPTLRYLIVYTEVMREAGIKKSELSHLKSLIVADLLVTWVIRVAYCACSMTALLIGAIRFHG